MNIQLQLLQSINENTKMSHEILSNDFESIRLFLDKLNIYITRQFINKKIDKLPCSIFIEMLFRNRKFFVETAKSIWACTWACISTSIFNYDLSWIKLHSRIVIDRFYKQLPDHFMGYDISNWKCIYFLILITHIYQKR